MSFRVLAIGGRAFRDSARLRDVLSAALCRRLPDRVFRWCCSGTRPPEDTGQTFTVILLRVNVERMETTIELTEQFAELMRGRLVAGLGMWLDLAEASGLPAFLGLARSI